MRHAALCLLAVLAAAPAQADPRWPDVVDRHVEAVRATIRTMDLDGFRAVVDDPRGALLIDVREADEVARGRIPGTTHVPRGLVEFRIWTLLGHPAPVDTARVIYVQCQTGNRATLAARQLQDVGFSNVTAVVMDFAEWERRGHPVAR
jgi:rhodanese-related sulfurtransferase